jgi:hypothetical protein
MRFTGLFRKTADGSHHPGLRVPGFQSVTSLDFRTKPLAVLCAALRAHFWGRTARRRYEWMRSSTPAKDGA